MTKEQTKSKDTEERILNAASLIFHKKGYAATKTREIAEAAEVNLALVNYYFRSKKKLYETVMFNTLQHFFSGILVILNNNQTTLKEKVEAFVNAYIDMLSEHPHMAPFILNAVREYPEYYIGNLKLPDLVMQSSFATQFQEGVVSGKIPNINPIHFMINLAGLTVFPFLAQPIITNATKISQKDYKDMLDERRALIPKWIEAMLTVS